MTPSLHRAVRVVAGVAAAVMLSTYCAKDSGPPSGPGGSGTPASIVVASASDTLATSGTMQFTATARDAAGNVVAITPTWSVVSGAGTITSTGMFTAAATPGTTTIRATSGSVSGSATIVVREANTTGPLATITVAPNPASVGVGGTQQFTASGKDAQGHTVAITPTWSMASGSGTITSSGLYTAGAAPGTATVKATSGTVSGTATVTVTAAPVAPIATIVVSPNNETILIGSTQQFSAVGKDAAGNTVPFTPTWSVSGGGTIDGSGRFTAGASAGTSTIRASQGGVAGSATVAVSGTRLVFYGPGQSPPGSRLLWKLVQPGACNAADGHVIPIIVMSMDHAGNLVPNGDVTLRIGSNPGGGMLSGMLTESPTAPVPSYVVFHDVRISAAGNGYTLVASSPGKVSAVSQPFDIVPSPHAPAVRLFFDRVVCTDGDRGNVWPVGTPHTIEVTAVDDAFTIEHPTDGEFEGNVVTSYSGAVTISVVSGGRLSGTLTVNAVNGRASFPDLVPQDAGDYVIKATAAGLILHTWAFRVTP